MTKTIQYAKYAAALALLLLLPVVFYPQEGLIGMTVNLAYFAAGLVVYAGFMHIGETTKSRLMKYAALTISAIICIFIFFNILQNTPYKMTTAGKEAAMILMLPQVIYGLAIIGLGISLPKLETTLGKTAALAAVTYTITGILYTAGWVMNEAAMTMEMDGNLIMLFLKTALVVSIFAQAATILFFQSAEKKLQ